MEVVRSKRVAVAPPWRVPRLLRRVGEGVKRKRVVLRMPDALVVGLVVLVARWEREAWKGVS